VGAIPPWLHIAERKTMTDKINSTDVDKLIKHLDSLYHDDKLGYYFENTFTDHTRKLVEHQVTQFLARIPQIDTARVDSKAATWEDYYPNMALRLLAIEALDKFGESFTPSSVEKPNKLHGYPYHLVIHYVVRWLENDEDCVEYLSNTDEYNEPPSLLNYPTGARLETSYEWKINNPFGKIIVEVAFRPIRAIPMIKLNMQITPTSIDFGSDL
jgi:hypothetical protein